MFVRCLGLLALIILFSGRPVEAQDPPIPDHPVVSFQSRPEVIVKLSSGLSGRPVRGRLINLSSVELLVDTGKLSPEDRQRGEIGQHIAMERIANVTSKDGRFKFTADEDIKVIVDRALKAYSSATLVDDAGNPIGSGNPNSKRSKQESGFKALQDSPLKMSDSDMVEPDDKRPGSPTRPKPKGLGKGGFGGLKNLAKDKKTDTNNPDGSPDEAESDPGNDSTEMESDASTVDTQDVLVCSNCNKQIPQSAMKSGVCPFCKTTFLNAASAPGTAGRSPFGPANTGAGAFAPAGSPPPAGQVAPAASPVASNTVVVQGGGFTFDQVPNWAKGGLFILLVLVGYHILFNR